MNPEISAIINVLISALADPIDMNRLGLEALLSTHFTHYIDAPSLSLIIPIIDYALTQKRASKPREDACSLVGSISQLVRSRDDLLPYINELVGGLRNAIADNDNEVRLYAARAIG